MPLLTHRHALSGDPDLLQRLSSEEYYGFFWVQMALTDTETQQKLKPLFLTRIFSVREPTFSQEKAVNKTRPPRPLYLLPRSNRRNYGAFHLSLVSEF